MSGSAAARARGRGLRGLVLGRFLPYHAGHAHLIRTARGQVDDLAVLVCSIAAETIPGGHRHQWVRASHPDCRVVHVSEEVPQAPENDPAFWPIDLAERFETVWVPEYGRPYCEGRDASALVLAAFEAIAWGQATWEDTAAAGANRALICDTELHTTCTWSDMIAGERPAWLTAAARGGRYDLVLMLDADVEWVDDGTRVLGRRRVEHVARLRAELEAAGWDWLVVSGGYEQRLAVASAAVEALVGRKPCG